MIIRGDGARYLVRLSVPRTGSVRAWGAVSGDFERRLDGQQSAAVTGPRVESETRRGRDYIRVTISMTVSAPDVAQALVTAWRVFGKAAGDDAAGWDTAGASAEVRPGLPLTETGRRPAVPGERGQSLALDPSSLSAAGACPGGPVPVVRTGHGTGLLSAPARRPGRGRR